MNDNEVVTFDTNSGELGNSELVAKTDLDGVLFNKNFDTHYPHVNILNIFNERAWRKGLNTIYGGSSWQKPPGTVRQDILNHIKPKRWINSSHYMFAFFDEGYMEILTSDDITIQFYAYDYATILKWYALMDEKFVRAKTLTTAKWYYRDSRGDLVNMPIHLSAKKVADSYYPYLKTKPITKYFDQFLESEANVLICIGPPGTGKTNFIKHMLNYKNSDACITYDQDIMKADQYFIEFMTDDDSTYCVFEDADTFLSSRNDGNDIMHKFLNLSDGLVSSKNKKFIFSTNLPSISAIDEALLRPGRCFDVINFRPLTKDEAVLACKDIGTTVPEGMSEYPLTSLFNQYNNSTKQKVGF